ncbi:hypothetical protein EJB05_04411, partial [Eragrostis curvula]
MENLDTGLYSLRRLNLSHQLFYPSTAAAEAATARSQAAVQAYAESQAGYKHGLRFLNATATSLDPLPAASINFKPCGPSNLGDTPLDLVALLGDESKILCADLAGRTSLYDAEAHAVVTVPDLRSPKGRDAIPISITRAAVDGDPDQGDSIYVRSRTPDPNRIEDCFEELRYGAGRDVFSEDQLFRGWCSLPPPPFLCNPSTDELPEIDPCYDKLPADDMDPCYDDYEFPAEIDSWTVVGGSNIYISSMASGTGTYCFDTVNWQWTHVGKWTLPFHGKAEYVPELNLWIGLSDNNPFHLCASDLSAVDFDQPPDCLRSFRIWQISIWLPFHLDLINLGSGRFCVVKMFRSTKPRDRMVCFSDTEEDDDDEVFDCPDVINWEFAVLTGVEGVRCDGEAPLGRLKIIRHQSRYHTFKDDLIHWVL